MLRPVTHDAVHGVQVVAPPKLNVPKPHAVATPPTQELPAWKRGDPSMTHAFFAHAAPTGQIDWPVRSCGEAVVGVEKYALATAYCTPPLQ